MGIETGFMGPNYSISTACATANYAFVAAANHIRKGEVDIMLAGGSEAPIIPVGLGGFVACRSEKSLHFSARLPCNALGLLRKVSDQHNHSRSWRLNAVFCIYTAGLCPSQLLLAASDARGSINFCININYCIHGRG